MKPFDALTRRSQARRLRALALNALAQYDLDLRDLRLLGVYTNFLYRVRTTDGATYVLRVCTPGWRTETDLRSEAMWLQALHRDTDLGAPVPVAARSGEFVIEATAPTVPGVRRSLLMSWLPGPLLAADLSEANLCAMGALFARLHAHGARWTPPQGFTQRRMDREYARDEEDVLFSCQEGFTPHTREVMERAWGMVDGAFRRLYGAPADGRGAPGLQVIHNDLHHENIKRSRGRLRPFDFEDTIWGYPVQDIAMAMQDLMLDVAPQAYDPLLDAFRQGYEAHAAWPEGYEGQIDAFRVGRLFWVANYVARYQRPYLRQHVDWTARMVEGFLETGRLRKA